MAHPSLPLTIENALAKIIDRIGLDRAASESGSSRGYVSAWRNPRRREQISMVAARKLDSAYQAAGGEGAPLHEAYGVMLEAAAADRLARTSCIAHQIIDVMKETAEAQIALVRFSQSGATDADRRDTAREVEQAIGSLTRTLPTLIGGTGPCDGHGGGRVPGGTL